MTKTQTTSFPRGSEWRRWDLHVHSPLSIVQRYGGDTSEAWDRFINEIRSLPAEIAVIGITDYLFVDGYERLLARRNEIPNIVAIFPNIEFRLNTFSGTVANQRRHNFHVIFDPAVPVETIRGQLLNCLASGYRITDKTRWQQTPNRDSLSQLGRLVKSAAPPDNTVHGKTDLMVGFDNITYDRQEIMDLLDKDCFKGRVLTGMGYSEWDQSRWDQSAAEKRDLINSCSFALTSNDDVAKVAEHVAQLRDDKLNSLVLHSSDAHSFERIGKTKLWIKADPTFAGLKQVVNEPERVLLGDAPPQKLAHRTIDRISIPASAGWFADDFELPLNEGLVAIVGGRGSGKSALSEMIACAAGALEPTDESFVTKAARHDDSISGTGVRLTWKDGSSSEGAIDGERAWGESLVQYLPQKAVEELCAPGNHDELVKQIESVIFQALDETSTMGASDFTELKDTLLSGFDMEKEQLHAAVRGANAELDSLRRTIGSVVQKQKDLAARKEELEKLKAGLPVLPPEDEKAQEELAVLNAHRAALEAKVVELRKTQERISALSTKVRLFAASVDAFKNDLASALESLGVPDVTGAIRFDEAAISAALVQRSTAIQASIDAIRSGGSRAVGAALDPANPHREAQNLDAVTKLVEERTKATKAFETQKLKFQQHKTQIAHTERSIGALEGEIKSVESESKPRADVLRERRVHDYAAYFAVAQREREEVERLYEPLQAILAGGSETDRRLRFVADVRYDVDGHVEKGLAILDRTRRGNFRDVAELRGELSAMADAFKRSGFTLPGIRAALNRVHTRFTRLEGEDASAPIKIESQLREGYTLADFDDWLLDASHFTVVSALKFDDTDLHLLSPGQKGIVLLMLYLGLDKADTRPLIIDQPEDNLDNLSVYRDLIRLFRDRKADRQIILITHNPNLVVNTDAEQVIVAAYDGKGRPRVAYESGSLENQAEQLPDVPVEDLANGILEKVCEILEGGHTAFSSRRRVYTLSPKLT